MSLAPPGAILFHGPPDRDNFALTFDDGPGPATPSVVELLERREAGATFFMVGSQVERFPDLARAVRDAGHEIGSHSMTHLEHQHAPRDPSLSDMLDGARAIERVLGVEPRLYRAPYGHFAPVTLAEAERRGWTCVHWSAEGLDWREEATAESIAELVLADLRPGAIVLLHDSRQAHPIDCSPMLGALELVLDEAVRRGLRPVTLGELLA